MTTKKVIGYFFIALAILLLLTAFAQLTSVITTVLSVFVLFTGRLNGYESGKIVGQLIYWVFHFAGIILLLKYGRKWTKKAATVNTD